MDRAENPIERLLNSSTPHAPTSAEEVRERLASAASRSPELESSGTGHTAPGGIDPPSPAQEPARDNSLHTDSPAPTIDERATHGLSEFPALDEESVAAQIEQGLSTSLSRAQELTEHLRRTHATGTDDDHDVEAVVNGLGELVDLRIEGSATRRAHRLGESIVVAISRARGAARKSESALDNGYLTGQDVDNIRTMLTTPPAHTDFGMLDTNESIESRDVIAQGLELRQTICSVTEGLKQQELAEEIGVAAGRVTQRLDGSGLHIDLPRRVLRDVGAPRLARQLTEAVKQIERRAAAERSYPFNSILMRGLPLGTALRELESRTTDAEHTTER